MILTNAIDVSFTHWTLGDLNEIFRYAVLKLVSVIDGWGITTCEINLRWMAQDLTDYKSTFV